jgi:hypothetical protein
LCNFFVTSGSECIDKVVFIWTGVTNFFVESFSIIAIKKKYKQKPIQKDNLFEHTLKMTAHYIFVKFLKVWGQVGQEPLQKNLALFYDTREKNL